MRHVCERRPLTLRFDNNPRGYAAPRGDGALRVTVCTDGPMGVRFIEHGGCVVLKGADGSGELHVSGKAAWSCWMLRVRDAVEIRWWCDVFRCGNIMG